MFLFLQYTQEICGSIQQFFSHMSTAKLLLFFSHYAKSSNAH